MSMAIEKIMPQVVGGMATLRDRLVADARTEGYAETRIEELLAALPRELANAQCFLDRMTGLWRYEFGEPFYLEKEKQFLWGAHMWVAVPYLRRGLTTCLRRVSKEKRDIYLARLDNREKHLDVLSEMIPLLNVGISVPADFEVVGRGQGNRSIDWLLRPVGGREILVDVKSRSADLIEQMDQTPAGTDMPAPTHDPSLLFRSIEQKLETADPATQLQGIWISTHIKQEAGEIEAAFQSLDPGKVHFAILAHWEPGGLIMVRHEADRSFLASLFGIDESEAFTFRR